MKYPLAEVLKSISLMRLSLKRMIDFTLNSGISIIIKNWIKWKKFPAVTEFMRLLKNLKKIQDFNGIWTRNLAIPVRCSNQLSYEATEIGSWSIVFIYVPVKEMNVIDVHEINHIRTAEMKSKTKGPRSCERNLSIAWEAYNRVDLFLDVFVSFFF